MTSTQEWEGEQAAELDRLLAGLGLAEAPARKLGRYTNLQKIGEGGMGVIYRADDSELGRQVAIKFVHARGLGDSKHLQQRLRREARTQATLSSHENIVTLHDVVHDEHGLFVVMEFVDGPTLREWQAELRSREAILAVYLAAGRGLVAAHESGIVHRDFKPENVFVTRKEERVLVGDFGLANLLPKDDDGSDGPAASRSAAVLGLASGTQGYMSPEQLAGEPATPRADLFSFCVALWEALTGVLPFEEQGAGVIASASGAAVARANAAVARRQTRAEPRSPGLAGESKLPPGLRRILRRGLAARPDARQPNMRELLADLERWQRRRRWGFGLLAFVFALGLVAALWSALDHRRDRVRCPLATELAEQNGQELRRLGEWLEQEAASPAVMGKAERALARLDRLAGRVCRLPPGTQRERQVQALWTARRSFSAAVAEPVSTELLLELFAQLDDPFLLDAPPASPAVAERIDASRHREDKGDAQAALAELDKLDTLAATPADLAHIERARALILARRGLPGDHEVAIDALSRAVAHAERVGSSLLRARAQLLAAKIRVTRLEQPRDAWRTLTELGPTLFGATRLASRDRAEYRETKALIVAKEGHSGAALVGLFAALIQRKLVHDDPVGAARTHLNIGIRLEHLGAAQWARAHYVAAVRGFDWLGLTAHPTRMQSALALGLLLSDASTPKLVARASNLLEEVYQHGEPDLKLTALEGLVYLGVQSEQPDEFRRYVDELEGRRPESPLVRVAKIASGRWSPADQASFKARCRKLRREGRLLEAATSEHDVAATLIDLGYAREAKDILEVAIANLDLLAAAQPGPAAATLREEIYDLWKRSLDESDF